MRLITFQKLGEANNSPRFWLESDRLNTIGFPVGTHFNSVASTGNRVIITPSDTTTRNVVSFRRAAGTMRPIVDINSSDTLKPVGEFQELKVNASYRRIEISPSIRAFHIHKHLNAKPPFPTVEFCSGGGLMGAATNEHYKIVAGVEVEPDYADVWQRRNPKATLIQSDIRLVHSDELPYFSIGLVGIPCTSHSLMGRAKKSLGGKPELGDTGDLFISMASIAANRMPLAWVFENVPSFGSSLAGLTLKSHLEKLGYYTFEMILEPNEQWGEPQDRRRWVMVATLKRGFEFHAPMIPFTGGLSEFLDAPNELMDREDSERIAKTVEGLRRHNARHAAQGHGFGFTTINRSSTRVPTLVRSYHKINTGPFVETEFGLRMLRKNEAEKLMGCSVDCDHYATAIQVLFQGVQTRIFRSILSQLSQFLTGNN